MAAIALPVALLFGVLSELVSGLIGWALGGDRKWWRGVSGLWSDIVRLTRDRSGRERVSVVEAGGATASMFGAGLAAAGALGIGPDGLVLVYLALVVASAGALVVSWEQTEKRRRLTMALAELALAVGLGTMFLRYGALDLEAVRGTQQILGTGLVLGPVPTALGLLAAAKAFAWSTALGLPSHSAAAEGEVPGAGPAVLLRLYRWSLAGAASLVAGVLLAGGGLEPFTADSVLPMAAGTGAFAVALGVADAVLRKLPDRWLLAVPGLALLLGGVGAALVVLS